MNDTTKVCKYCFSEFSPAPKEGPARFAGRVYCCSACANASNGEKGRGIRRVKGVKSPVYIEKADKNKILAERVAMPRRRSYYGEVRGDI